MEKRLQLLTAAILLGATLQAGAVPINLTIANQDFLIPVAGESGELTLYSDGSAPTTSGFNALGSQSFYLAAGDTSTGDLTLNLYFSGFPLGGPIEAAELQFTVNDFDFLPDAVTASITLTEVAIIDAVNGNPLLAPINLVDYLPGGTTDTDDELIVLDPINLLPPLTSADFTDPFVLSLGLQATVVNNGSRGMNLYNTPEALITNLSLSLTPVQIAEPSPLSLSLLGLLAITLGNGRRFLRPRR